MSEEAVIQPAEELNRAIEAEDQSAILAVAGELHYADLAEIYQDLTEEKRIMLPEYCD